MDRRILRRINNKSLDVDAYDTGKWDHLDPEDRLRLYKKCKKECFMRPSQSKKAIAQDPLANLKFPVCRPASCTISAAGVLAANRRARMTKTYPDVVKETANLIATLGLTKKARAENNTDDAFLRPCPENCPSGPFPPGSLVKVATRNNERIWIEVIRATRNLIEGEVDQILRTDGLPFRTGSRIRFSPDKIWSVWKKEKIKR